MAWFIKVVFFIALSCFASIVAIYSVMYGAYNGIELIVNETVGLVLVSVWGGAIGAGILFYSLKSKLLKQITNSHVIVLSISGAILGVITIINIDNFDSFWQIFVIWQAGTAFVLGICLSLKKDES